MLVLFEMAPTESWMGIVYQLVDAVVDETDSQMEGLRGGRFTTHGSPEYTRKIALMTQRVDALLTAEM